MAYKPKVLEVAAGGTGAATLTAHGVLVGEGTSAVTVLAVGATGTVLSGSTGADPVFTSTPAVTSITLGGGSSLAAYVEGTFTPTFQLTTAGTSAFTYSSQTGRYSKIGNVVNFQARIALSNFSIGSGSGSLQMAGLPFTAANVTNQQFVCTCTVTNTTFGVIVSWYVGSISPNTAVIDILGCRTATTTLALDSAGISNTTTISIEGWYSTV